MAHLHWSFFEMIDEELHTFSRQVEFAEANFPMYSVYLARLYLSICSEIDVVAKLLCQRIEPASERANIHDYRRIIPARYYFLPKLKITVLPVPLELIPWKIWQDKESKENPDWWKSHQNVKHHRDEFFKEANLGNVLKSAAGLLALLVYLNHPELKRFEVSANFLVFEVDIKRVPKPVTFMSNLDLPDINGLGANEVR
jgi:hypothetical protein